MGGGELGPRHEEGDGGKPERHEENQEVVGGEPELHEDIQEVVGGEPELHELEMGGGKPEAHEEKESGELEPSAQPGEGQPFDEVNPEGGPGDLEGRRGARVRVPSAKALDNLARL